MVMVSSCVVRDAALIGSLKNVGVAVVKDGDLVSGIGDNGKVVAVGDVGASQGDLGSDLGANVVNSSNLHILAQVSEGADMASLLGNATVDSLWHWEASTM